MADAKKIVGKTISSFVFLGITAAVYIFVFVLLFTPFYTYTYIFTTETYNYFDIANISPNAWVAIICVIVGIVFTAAGFVIGFFKHDRKKLQHLGVILSILGALCSFFACFCFLVVVPLNLTVIHRFDGAAYRYLFPTYFFEICLTFAAGVLDCVLASTVGEEK